MQHLQRFDLKALQDANNAMCGDRGWCPVHRLSVRVGPWVFAGLELHQQSMDLMRALLLLEDKLCAAMEFQPREPWGLMRALEPALFKWTVDKLELLQGWMQRLMSVEEWKPVTAPQGCARSALSTPLPAPEGSSSPHESNATAEVDEYHSFLLVRGCTLLSQDPAGRGKLEKQKDCPSFLQGCGIMMCCPANRDAEYATPCCCSQVGNDWLLLHRSCVETMKIADETLDALFDMELPLPRPVVRSLAEGIDTILQKCLCEPLTPTCVQTKPDMTLLRLILGGTSSSQRH